MKTTNLFTIGTLAFMASPTFAQKTTPADRPNIIYILADDLGYGDISCFGQKKFSTPHIDKLATKGIRLTQHYAGCTVSAPSRSALLTGLHTGHTYIRGNREMSGQEGQFPMQAEAYTLAEMFKDAGYTTGAFGKWGLGYPGSEGDPNHQGFDEFFGYNCQALAHRYYPQHLWHNQEKVILPENDTKNKTTYAPDLIHEKALAFIKANKNNPFFAYIPIIQPHAELIVPDDEILEQYKGMFPEKPFVANKPGSEYGATNFKLAEYCSQPMPRATFAAMISRIDKYVGDIMNLLEEQGIDDNTIIIFTSDNGPHQEGGADPDFFESNSRFRGYKRDMSDGGIRVPMIAYWKNKIKPGTTSDHISAFWDMMSTFAEIVRVEPPKNTDGISILPTLLGKNKKQKQHDFLYWEFLEKGGSMAVRMGEWKAIRINLNRDPDAPVALYNIYKDTEERHNVADQYPEIAARALEIMKREHVKTSDYPFAFEKE